MFAQLIVFESSLLFRRKQLPVMLAAFLAFGLLLGFNNVLSAPNTARNAPYAISYVSALMSMLALIPATLLSAQSILRDTETRFGSLLYALPLKKVKFMLVRWLFLFAMGAVCFLLFQTGIAAGHIFSNDGSTAFQPFALKHYAVPFLQFQLPAVLLCTAVLGSVAWLTQSRLAVYTAAIGVYILYLAIAALTNSPFLVTGANGQLSDLQTAALTDPFGISAFFEQTRYWTALERNQNLLHTNGMLMWNRLGYAALSAALVAYTIKRFRFTIGKNAGSESKKQTQEKFVHVLQTTPAFDIQWKLLSIVILTRNYLRTSIKSLPFLIALLGWLLVLIMEITTGEVAGNARIPARIASTQVMVENMLGTFPIIGLLVMLYYGSLLHNRNNSTRFAALENATPVTPVQQLTARWITLWILPMLLLGAAVLVCILLQLVYGCNQINGALYLSIADYLGWPLLLSALLIISLQQAFRKSWIGLLLAVSILAIGASPLGRMLGIQHPLLRWAPFFRASYSDMNGFGGYAVAHHIKMLYWSGIAAAIATLSVIAARSHTVLHVRKLPAWPLRASFALFLGVSVIPGYYMYTEIPAASHENNKKQQREAKYMHWKNAAMPVVTSVKTAIDLYPGKNVYYVTGSYTLKNKTTQSIAQLLINYSNHIQLNKLQINNASQLENDSIYGYCSFQLKQPLKPGDSLTMYFEFSSRWSPFGNNDAHNAIVENGAFIRISNFFPLPGYNEELEINDADERKRRGMPEQAALPPADTIAQKTYEYNYIRFEAIISTAEDQTAIGTGQLIKKWKSGNRNHFHYAAQSPIPFRFAVASAKYAIREHVFGSFRLIVYHHPDHHTNINRLIAVAEKTLNYCESNFGPCPYRTIQLVEISEFATGFAGTAYPGSFFINENFGFVSKFSHNPGNDILNELVSHELSHIWWGIEQLNPPNRKGSKLLTETLAMYTELMIYAHTYGEENLPLRIATHKDIYLSSRSYSQEKPLVQTHPGDIHLHYNKGMVVMYQLWKMMGEKKINTALYKLLHAHAYPQNPPSSYDLVSALKTEADSAVHAKIDEWFTHIVTHKVCIEQAVYSRNSRTLRITITAKKFAENAGGALRELPFSEAVNVCITNADGTQTRQLLTPVNGKIVLNTTHNAPPKSVEIDTELMLMDTDPENNYAVPEIVN